MKAINHNLSVFVILTDYAYQIMADDYNKWAKNIKSKNRDLFYYKSQANSKGYTEFQIWRFIELFGIHYGSGLQPIIANGDLVFDDKDLKDIII